MDYMVASKSRLSAQLLWVDVCLHGLKPVSSRNVLSSLHCLLTFPQETAQLYGEGKDTQLQLLPV